MKKIIFSLGLLSSLVFANQPTNQNLPTINPFEEIQRIQAQMEKMFQEMEQKFFNDPFFKGFSTSIVATPKVDIINEKDRYVIKTNIPGASKDGIKISTKDNLLKIEANIKKETKEEKKDFLKQERIVQSYQRVITLPKDADTDHIKTEYKNGVLKIYIPKKK